MVWSRRCSEAVLRWHGIRGHGHLDSFDNSMRRGPPRSIASVYTHRYTPNSLLASVYSDLSATPSPQLSSSCQIYNAHIPIKTPEAIAACLPSFKVRAINKGLSLIGGA